MATRACVKILLSTVVRRERAYLTSCLSKLSTRSSTQLFRCAPLLNSAHIGLARNFCAETKPVDEPSVYKCRMRGLPWAATESDVKKFLGDVEAKSIELKYDRSGRFSGNVVVELESDEDLTATLAKHGNYMQHRHIDIFPALGDQDDQPRSKDPNLSFYDEDQVGPSDDSRFVVKCRGLPWRVTQEDMDRFFEKINVKQIRYLHSNVGLFNGIIFVEVNSQEDMDEVLKLNGEYIGSRHVDVRPSSGASLDYCSLAELSPMVKLMNLPYSCTRGEIKQFFTGLNIVEDGIKMPLDRLQRPTGLAIVKFASPEEAREAAQRTGESLGNREVHVRQWTMATDKAPRSQKTFKQDPLD